MKTTISVSLLLGAFLASGAQDADILIRNARVLDGTGNPDFRADVAVRGERIIAIGKLVGALPGRVIKRGESSPQ